MRWGLFKLWGLYLYYGRELSHEVYYSTINLGVLAGQERCHRPWSGKLYTSEEEFEVLDGGF